MGDWAITDEREQNIGEEETNRISSRTHHRSVSYGSFLPTFTVDFRKLRDLLPDKEECGNHETRTEPLFNKAHSRVDSLINNSLLDDFISALGRELESLHIFMALHLSQIEEQMEDFEKRIEDGGTLDISNAVESAKEKDLDNISVGMDSGIEDDHLSSNKGFLSRIQEVLHSLKRNLDASMLQLDELVGIYDDRTQGSVARTFLNGRQPESVQLQDKINTYISKIDTKLEQFNDEDGTSQKVLELKTFQRAKKEKMKLLDVLGLLLLIGSAAAITYFSVTYPSSRWTIFLRLLRSPLLIVAYIYLIGFNMMAWARYGINYISIFDFPRNSIPTPKFMFQVGSMLSFMFTMMIVVCLVARPEETLYVSDKVTAFTMWGIILLFWINPLNVLNRLGRFSFLVVFVRVLMAPFPVVMFADFWFADQLNSILAFMLDIQYLFCYSFSSSSWDNGSLALKNCTMVSNGIRPVLSCMPALWRLLQCLRCYQKTRKIAHLLNAVKYFTTFPVVIFATFFAVKAEPFSNIRDIDLDKTGWMILAWMISSLIHALFTFFWDIYMDWGLFRIWKGYVLRPTLYYSKWTYFVAIGIDFVIRFACTAKLTLAIVYHLDSDWIYTLLILSEVLRRVLWNFFRIEYEQVLRSN